MNLASIRTVPFKSLNYNIYNLGFYGNRAKAWNTRKEVYNSGWTELVCIRDVRGTQRGNEETILPRFNISLDNLDSVVNEVSQKIPEEFMRFNQSMPDNHLTIQGEVFRSKWDGLLHMHYSRVQKPMRDALIEKSFDAKGLIAGQILKHELWSPSYEELQELLSHFDREYPTALPNQHSSCIVEFSSYAIPVGDLPGRNTVFWEVRNY